MSLDPLFTQLLSDDDTKVLEAIEKVDQRGDAMAIVPMLHALVKARDHAVQQRITTILFEVKAKGAREQLLAALDIPELHPVRSTVLASFWNAGMDMREHLLQLAGIAAKGSASEALECLTIVQEQSAWPEKAARAAAKDLRLASTSEKDELKASVLTDIAEELERRLGK
ncbi:MAG: hypothetical protein IPJ76_18650 [Flavobacteriales bacterium]|nr:MAG: hypothetical protein IPJ76_18650 [Flavobacteriales bacterium]